MARGTVPTVPDDGKTTRQRRTSPLVVVHSGAGKGKSTAAFGLALRGWNQGWSIGVFQFVKSAKWRVGEENALTALGRLHEQTGEGGPVEWHKMGAGWSWTRKAGEDDDHARDAAEGWAEVSNVPVVDMARRFEDAGVAVPTNWDEFVAAAPKLREAGKMPLAMGNQPW